ncbi:hypothetical protein ANCDUO_10146 [Ancylostoma duodenale]|uniref:Uncharacterized protein n=1 Tax=Ancylostoma duodenale TaxID=51022 RepID=A0A0C2GEM5_9BILA|nr:hypothetical protein ANCDUO_10146 [Ancylostoma duodenale]
MHSSALEIQERSWNIHEFHSNVHLQLSHQCAAAPLQEYDIEITSKESWGEGREGERLMGYTTEQKPSATGLTRAVRDWTPRNVERTTGRPPTRWSDFFTNYFKERYYALRVPRVNRIHWTTLARERDKWKDCWRPFGISEDQRKSSCDLKHSQRGSCKKKAYTSIIAFSAQST